MPPQSLGPSQAAADFNGDGLADLVSGNAVYWNDPSNPGSFSTSSTLDPGCVSTTIPDHSPTGCVVGSVVVTDLNGDGKPDFVELTSTTATADTGPSSSIKSFLNDSGAPGQFTLAATLNFPSSPLMCGSATSGYLGFSPYALAIGDFNGDGVPDLAALGEQTTASGNSGCPSAVYANAIAVSLGDPTSPGNFLTPTYPLPGFSALGSQTALNAIVAADFNGDGLSDLALTNGNAPFGLVLGIASDLYTATVTLPGIVFYGSGAQNIVASLSGNATSLSAQSTPLTVPGAGTTAATSILPVPSSNLVETGTTLKFSVAVSAVAFGPPNGTITLSDAATVIATATLDANGNATILVGPLAPGNHLPGNHLFSASYAGTEFFSSSTSATAAVEVFGSSNPAVLSASPNPIIDVTNVGSVAAGVTTLTWNAPAGITQTELTIGAPNGVMFSGGGPAGSATTGLWAQEGMTVYLQDVSGGKPLTAANTLATLTTHLSLDGYLTAIPNPIFQTQIVDGLPRGVTTLYWSAPTGVTNTELLIGAPNGVLFGAGGPSGKATTGLWTTDGMTFYLQDTTDGKPLTAANTLGLVTVHLGQPVLFSASPDPISNISVVSGVETGSTALTWNAPNATAVAIYSGQPGGALISSGGPSGTTPSISVTDGTVFYLQDASNGNPTSPANTLATIVIHLQQPAQISLNPNPIPVLTGQLGTTTVTWSAPGATNTAVLSGPPPGGTVLAQGASSGSVTTGPVVTDGMTFYLQNTSGGRPLTVANTLATVTAHLQSEPELVASPNPITDITVVGGVEAGVTTLQWNAPAGVSSTALLVGPPPNGAIMTEGSPSGSEATGVWAQEGMTFYLQDTSGGKPLTSANTLATTTIHLLHQVQFNANPNPITNATIVDGLPRGVTTLSWEVTGVENVEIHIGAPGGVLFSGGGPSGTATTGLWTTNGMTFYLQDTTGGRPLTSANTLGVVSVQLQ